MSVTTTFANQLLGLILEGTAIANIADNAASSPVTQYYLSLHSADPTASGDQSSSEITYTGYARIAIDRSSSAWTVAGGQDTNDAQLEWAICTGGEGETVTHLGLGRSSSGTGTLLLFGELDSPFLIQVGTKPIISAGELAAICS